MDDRRVGAAFRAVRIRRGWTQAQVGAKAHLGKSCVSQIERGHLDHVSLPTLRRVAVALELNVSLMVRSRYGEVDRLLNSGHAALHEALAHSLGQLPDWIHAHEVSFAIYADRGVIDVLAFHGPTGSLLIIELKTEFVSLEDLLTTMDVRMRHAQRIASDRGWRARSVSAWIVFSDTATNRRRVAAHSSVLRNAYPSDGRTMRKWLKDPSGTVRALSFWHYSAARGLDAKAATLRRVRKRGGAQTSLASAAMGGV